jgi:L-histidine N-alpha-methyltransferase
VATALASGDGFLLGVDLVKDPAQIEAAYNDSQGVTERFVRNGLTAVNRALRGDFEQSRFAFEARWDADREWMDIGFRSRAAQTVRLEELETELAFAAGEQLRFEVSTKFRREGIEAELIEAGLRPSGWWTDHAEGFALTLATV